MLTEEKISANKDRFLDLVRGITRPGSDLQRLEDKLVNSDFFTAPASAMYHASYRGGLCEHSLNVYDTLVKFCKAMYPDCQVVGENGIPKVVETCPYTSDSLKIVALFHDFDKMNKYEKTVFNKKVYCENGTKQDELGRFDWQSQPGYKRKESNDTFILGTHGENSVYMTESFLPLSAEEISAILAHHGIFGNPNLDVTAIYSRYHLACLLHLSDMASCYVIERT